MSDTRPVEDGASRTIAHARGAAGDFDTVEELIQRIARANDRVIEAALSAANRAGRLEDDESHTNHELEYLDLAQRTQAVIEQLLDAVRRTREQTQERENRHRDLSARLLRWHDEERRRIAVNLHDSTAQSLAALTMSLDMVEKASSELDDSTLGALARSRGLAALCFEEVRSVADQLHPPLIDEAGLPSALRWYVARFSERSGIQVELRCDEFERLPAAIEIALFRVVQEALDNVHLHASSPTASVVLRHLHEAVALEVHDQGQGIPGPARSGATRGTSRRGLGIHGMQERIGHLGGSCALESTGHGTIVRASIPLRKDTE